MGVSSRSINFNENDTFARRASTIIHAAPSNLKSSNIILQVGSSRSEKLGEMKFPSIYGLLAYFALLFAPLSLQALSDENSQLAKFLFTGCETPDYIKPINSMNACWFSLAL